MGSWKRATRSVSVVLPAPLGPTRATVCPPRTVSDTSASTAVPGRYSKPTFSSTTSRTTAGASTASGRSGLSGSWASTSNTRSMAASARWVVLMLWTIIHTGCSSSTA